MSFLSTISDSSDTAIRFCSSCESENRTENSPGAFFINGGTDYSLFIFEELPEIGKLKKAIPIVAYLEDGLVFVESPELHITESGKSFPKALAEFCTFFRHDYASIVETDDELLDSIALEIKKIYLEYL